MGWGGDKIYDGWKFEENFTSLRDLEEGNIHLDKANGINIYVKDLGNDHHLVKDHPDGEEYEVPHGRFPVFKKIEI